MTTMETVDRLAKGIPATSWMAYVAQNKPLRNEQTTIEPYLSVTRVPGGTDESQETILLAVDLGNVAAKIGLINGQGKFEALRIPTSYAPARTIRHGVSIPQWKITSDDPNEQESFYIGSDAVHGGDSLPLGPTHQRLANARYRRFVKASFVQALMKAGYQPGVYTLALGIGLRNEEIEEIEGKQTILPMTRAAIKQLCGTFTLNYRNARGDISEWTLVIEPSRIYSVAQTMGSFFAYYYTLEGTPSQQDIQHMTILDYGGGDTHVLDVQRIMQGRFEKFTASGERIGDGTVEIALGLKTEVKRLYGIEITQGEAQDAMISGTILRHGKYRIFKQ